MTPRMRTIKEVITELKTIDPDTAIREYFVRDLVNSNEIPYIKAGRKILVNFDKFLEYLNSPDRQTTNLNSGIIRRVNVG